MTGTATSKDAKPNSNWLTPVCSGDNQRQIKPSASKPRASMAKVNWRAALRCSAEDNMLGAAAVWAVIAQLPE
jgi:hypothetical protein